MTTSRSDPFTTRGNREWRLLWRCSLLAVLVGVLLASCREKNPSSPPSEAPPVVEPAAPEGLVLRGLLADPQTLWDAVRSGLEDTGRGLPKHYPLLLTELLGASPVLTGRFESAAPVRLALALESEQVHWIVAFRVVSGAEFVAELATGARAPFRATPHPGHVALARPGTQEFPAIGVSGSHLLLGSSARALEVLGAFVAREGFTDLQAPAGTLRVRSETGAGARLSRFFEAWWSTRGAEWRRGFAAGALPEWGELLHTALAPSLESLVQGFSRLLASVQRSQLSLAVEAGRVEISGEQAGGPPGQAVAGACGVLASSPLPSPLLAVAWTDPGTLRASLPLPSGSSAPALDVAFTGPALFGVADVEGQPVGFLDAGRPGSAVPDTAVRGSAVQDTAAPGSAALDPVLFGGALSELARRVSPELATSMAHRRVGQTEIWTLSSPERGRAPLLRVLHGGAGSRARWLVASEGAEQLTPWVEAAEGAPGATIALPKKTPFPWHAQCESLLFAALIGEGKRGARAWAWRSGEGFSLKASLPLAAWVPEPD